VPDSDPMQRPRHEHALVRDVRIAPSR